MRLLDKYAGIVATNLRLWPGSEMAKTPRLTPSLIFTLSTTAAPPQSVCSCSHLR